MYPLTFYAAFLGTMLSTAGVGYLALKGHDSSNPRTISRVVAQDADTLHKFRLAIWAGGTLIAITMFFFIVPRITYSLYVALGCGLIYCDELLLSIVPDRTKREAFIHGLFAYGMRLGMLFTALLFVAGLHGNASYTEGVLATIMASLSAMMALDHKRFIFYKLSFIGLSHVSVLVAAIALR